MCIGSVGVSGVHIIPSSSADDSREAHSLSPCPHHVLPVPLSLLRQSAAPKHSRSNPSPLRLSFLAPRAPCGLHLVFSCSGRSVSGRAGRSTGDHDDGGVGERVDVGCGLLLDTLFQLDYSGSVSWLVRIVKNLNFHNCTDWYAIWI